jgi:hypothetical protein
MSEEPKKSNFVPNSFQVPNLYVDEMFPLLDCEEQAMVIFACRRIFGWQKRTDRIAASQFADGCGIHIDTVTSRLKNLERFHILIQVSPNDFHKNEGPEWQLQLNDSAVDWDGLRARKTAKVESATRRTQAARDAAALKAQKTDPTLSDSPTPVAQTLPCPTAPPPTLSDSPTPYPVGQGTQNTIKSKIHIGAGENPEIVTAANKKVDALLEQERKAQEQKAKGKGWAGRTSFPDILLPLADKCVAKFGTPLKRDLVGWLVEISAWHERHVTPEDFDTAILQSKNWTTPPVSPYSLTRTIVAAAQKRRDSKENITPAAPISTFASHLDNFKPRSTSA